MQYIPLKRSKSILFFSNIFYLLPLLNIIFFLGAGAADEAIAAIESLDVKSDEKAVEKTLEAEATA